MNDWKKISIIFIRNQGGRVLIYVIGSDDQGLLRKYGSSISMALKALYPSVDVNYLSPSSASAEKVKHLILLKYNKHLRGIVNQVFPNNFVFSNLKKQ